MERFYVTLHFVFCEAKLGEFIFFVLAGLEPTRQQVFVSISVPLSVRLTLQPVRAVCMIH